MQNDMRDGLINLIIEAMPYSEIERQPNKLADYLIANGVIVPPCKVGDKVYCIFRNAETLEYYIAEKTVYEIAVSKYGMRIFISPLISFIEMEIGVKVFLTKEQAEQKLKELSENG